MDVKIPDRDLNKLKPEFRKKVDAFLKIVAKMGVFVTEAGRSKERQDYLVKQKLSFVKVSNHQLGLAIDIAFKDDSRTVQVEKELYPSDVKRWREVADIARQCGMDWGYDLWQWDKPHFQDNGKRMIDEGKMGKIEEKNRIFAEKAEAVNKAMLELNAITKELCELKGKEFKPYTLERKA